jgi:hypothetical protein
MVSFRTKNPNSGLILEVLEMEMLVYVRDNWNILRPLCSFGNYHLIKLVEFLAVGPLGRWFITCT